MSKEIIKPQQFAHVGTIIGDTNLSLSKEQIDELNLLYQGLDKVKPGQLIKGTILQIGRLDPKLRIFAPRT